MFNDMQSNPRPRNLWDDVVDFLGGFAKDAVTVATDINFYNENCKALNNYDIYEIVRRIGRTEERYSTEIIIFGKILDARDSVFPPPQQTMHDQLMRILNSQPYYYVPTNVDNLLKYQKELKWLTDNIPLFAAMKYGKEKGRDWIMDSIGEGVKEWFNRINDSNM